KTQRVMRMRTYTHLEVNMWAGGVSGTPYAGDLLPAGDALAARDQVLRVVGVDGDQVALVGEQDQLAVPALLAGKEHHAVVGGVHRRAFGAGQVDALVLVALALAESGDEHAGRRPGQRLAVGGRVERVRARSRNRGRPPSRPRFGARL